MVVRVELDVSRRVNGPTSLVLTSPLESINRKLLCRPSKEATAPPGWYALSAAFTDQAATAPAGATAVPLTASVKSDRLLIKSPLASPLKVPEAITPSLKV